MDFREQRSWIFRIPWTGKSGFPGFSGIQLFGISSRLTPSDFASLLRGLGPTGRQSKIRWTVFGSGPCFVKNEFLLKSLSCIFEVSHFARLGKAMLVLDTSFAFTCAVSRFVMAPEWLSFRRRLEPTDRKAQTAVPVSILLISSSHTCHSRETWRHLRNLL